ncbi:RAMP superfamily CRISPR-associated protein [Methanohalophilus sp.]
MTDYSTFQNRWQITAKLTLVTPLRIGGGQNAGAYSLSQSPVLLSYDSQTKRPDPYIPGSSFKGVLRSTVERIIRTFNENKSCIAVSNKRDNNLLCGKEDCIPCSIFGSQAEGASIRVQDAHLSDELNRNIALGERPHCATLYNKRGHEYVMQTKRKGSGQVPKTNPRFEEIVTANNSFDVTINLDNANEQEVGFVLLALNEFNHKRCCLGGGTSRGNGFVDVNRVRVAKKTVDNDDDALFQLKTEQMDPIMFCNAAKKYLKSIDNGADVARRDFDVYYRAYSDNQLEGNVVVPYELVTMNDFQMPGADEVTVTNQREPIIPGSTIKGFLRHTLISKGEDADTIDDLFGASVGNNQHRSRILISDAYPLEQFGSSDIIPENTRLKLWMVFDNIDSQYLTMISDILKTKCRITGKRISRTDKNGNSSRNIVQFKPKSLNKFEANQFLKLMV